MIEFWVVPAEPAEFCSVYGHLIPHFIMSTVFAAEFAMNGTPMPQNGLVF